MNKYIILFLFMLIFFIIIIQSSKINKIHNELTIRINNIDSLSSTKQQYLNRRIDLVDLQASEANRTATDAWNMIDRKRTTKWKWIEGKTIKEIDSIWNLYITGGALPK